MQSKHPDCILLFSFLPAVITTFRVLFFTHLHKYGYRFGNMFFDLGRLQAGIAIYPENSALFLNSRYQSYSIFPYKYYTIEWFFLYIALHFLNTQLFFQLPVHFSARLATLERYILYCFYLCIYGYILLYQIYYLLKTFAKP